MRQHEYDFYRYDEQGSENERGYEQSHDEHERSYLYGYRYEYDQDTPAPHEEYAAQVQIPQKQAKQYVFTKKGLALLLVCCIIVSTAFGTGGAIFAGNFFSVTTYHTFGSPPIRVAPVNIDIAEATGSRLSIQEIIDIAGDTVVEIATETVVTTRGLVRQIRPGAGSGVIVSTDGLIMTNHHVIDNSRNLTVTLNNGDVHTARLIGSDPITDIAVIKIDVENLTPVIFGNSHNVSMGDLAVVIGNPLGQFGGTATVGIISSLDRELVVEGQAMTLLQTDASINRGNSGGGIFNQYGEVIGIVTAKYQGPGIEGLGFAIPINIAKEVAMHLIEVGFVPGRPQIGITMRDLTATEDAIAHGVRFPGIYIVAVTAHNAREAGLMEGDMLHYIADTRIQSFDDVRDVLGRHNVGDTVAIVVVRGGEMLEFRVVLSEQGSRQE